MRRIAVVPARGGSKGIPRKNVAMVGGISLVERATQVALSCNLFSQVVVATDDAEIASLAKSAGADVPYLRSDATSSDKASSDSVIAEAVNKLNLAREPNLTLVLLEPTAVPRFGTDIRLVVDAIELASFDSAATVSRVDVKYHPLKQFTIGDEGELLDACSQTSAIPAIRRQDLAPSYIRNGLAYATHVQSFLSTGTLLGRRAAAVVIDHPVVNIDTPSDLLLARKLVSEILGNQGSTEHNTDSTDEGTTLE